MSELTQIRQALADALTVGLGSGFQVSAYLLSNPTYPSVQMFPSDIQFHQASQNGLAFWRFTIRVLFSLSTDIGAQQNLDALMGENSSGVKAAVEADPTLAGACDNLIVRTVGNYQTYVSAGGQQILAADWTVEIYR